MKNTNLVARPGDVAFIKVNNRWWALREHKWIPVTGTTLDDLPIHYDKGDPYERQLAEAIESSSMK